QPAPPPFPYPPLFRSATRLLFAWPPLCVLIIGAPIYLSLAQHWAAPLVIMTAAWLLISTAQNVLSWSAIAAQRFSPLTVGNALLDRKSTRLNSSHVKI